MHILSLCKGLVASVFFLTCFMFSQLSAGALNSKTECTALSKRFEYQCIAIIFEDGEYLIGQKGTVGATMPSMSMAHNVKPVIFKEIKNMSGHYSYTIQLEMHGVWMMAYDILEPIRGRAMEKLNFDYEGSQSTNNQ